MFSCLRLQCTCPSSDKGAKLNRNRDLLGALHVFIAGTGKAGSSFVNILRRFDVSFNAICL